jgi:Putative DNA-binding domain
MSATAFPLERVQRWMQAVVVHPGEIAEALAAPAAAAEVPPVQVGDVILPTEALSSAERVGIYHSMYLLRMRDALAGDYEALKHFLGDHDFFELVRAYVQAHPSRSYSLNRLGDHLPDFVGALNTLKRRDFCHDLARLECAMAQVFDAEEVAPLSEAQIAAVPAQAWEGARLKTIPAFRLLGFRYPVNAYLQTVREDNHDHPKARLRNEWIAIYRRDYAVWRLSLSRDAFDLLTDLAAGVPLGAAIEAALRRRKRAPSAEALSSWFREWVSGGVFARVEL